MKKTLSVLVMVVVMLTLCMGVVNAAQDFKVALSASSTKVDQGGKVVITVTLKDFVANETGINAFIGTLDYDKAVFETVKATDFVMKNGWSSVTYNENEGKFTSDNSAFMAENHEIFQLTLTAKANATIGNTTVTFKDLNGSDSYSDIFPADQKIVLTVKAASAPEPAPVNNTTPAPVVNTTPVNNTTSMPQTGVEDFVLPTIAVVAVLGIFAYVKYNRMDK